MRFIYKCRITQYNDSYNLNCEGNSKNRTLVFRGSETGFLSFLRRVKASDIKFIPRSVKNTTYKEMLKTGYFYVWSNMLPKQDIIKESFFDSTKTAKEYLSES